MAHFPEGCEVQQWPEFKSLGARLGIPEKPNSRIEITLGPEADSPVTVRHYYYSDGDQTKRGVVGPSGGSSHFVTGFEMYGWPEFEAFCRRLGVGYELMTTGLVIEIPWEGELVTITHIYRGVDTVFADPPVIWDKEVKPPVNAAPLPLKGLCEFTVEAKHLSTHEAKLDTRYVEEQMRKQAEEEERKAIENTTLHNKHWRTKQPKQIRLSDNITFTEGK
jgi:hypothetical protein